MNEASESTLPVISFIGLIGNAEIGTALSYGHGFPKRGRMPMHGVLQCLDGRFPIFHLNFKIRHDTDKFPLCNPSCTLLVRQVMHHVIMNPSGFATTAYSGRCWCHRCGLLSSDSSRHYPGTTTIAGPIPSHRNSCNIRGCRGQSTPAGSFPKPVSRT